MQPQEYSTESTIPITVTSSNSVSKQPLKSQKTFFSPHEPTKEDELIRYKYRAKILQNRTDKIKNYPIKEKYWKKLEKIAKEGKNIRNINNISVKAR
jgi:hypothetical protein